MKQLVNHAFGLTQKAISYMNPAREGDPYQRLNRSKGFSLSFRLKPRKIYA